MKRFVVSQSANVEMSVARTFLLEVPDDCSQDDAEELLLDVDEDIFIRAELGWITGAHCEWLDGDVDGEDTTLTPAINADEANGLPIIKLDNKK